MYRVPKGALFYVAYANSKKSFKLVYITPNSEKYCYLK